MIVWDLDNLYEPIPMCGCWVWLGKQVTGGYGVLYSGNRTFMAHRLLYERENGLITSNLEIDHLCRNPSCVNPAHLEAVTHQVNIKRGRRGWQKCPHGDAFRTRKSRDCAVCRKERQKRKSDAAAD